MRFFTAALFILLLNPLVAQRTFRAGLIAGVNGSQIQGDANSGFHEAGLVGGAFVCTDPTQRWYGQMELQYSHKGSRKFADPEIGDYNTFEIRLNYMEAPFLVRYNAGRVFAEMGETIGVLGKVREWDVNGEVTPTGYRRWETAFVVGMGYNFNDHWMLNLRYTNSILPVKKFAVPLWDPRFFFRWFNKGLYNNVLGFTVCYRFGGPANE